MADLKVPSLQHLCRHWHADPLVIKRRLVSVARNSPTFSYEALFGVVRDLLVFQVPYDQIVEGIRRIRRSDVRENFLSVLPLIRKHFDGIAPSFVQSVGRRFYPVSRNLLVPFDPPMIYGAGGRVYFPWFSFWRSNPVTHESLSLFVTIVEEVLLQDPDLEEAVFVVLDFSAPGPKLPRVLTVVDAANVPRVSEERKLEMLEAFAEGYTLAQSELAETSEPVKEDGASHDATKESPSSIPDLFGSKR